MAILTGAEPQHEIRSAISLTFNPGKIYLESTLNESCQRWLKTLPGFLWKKALGIQGKKLSAQMMEEELQKIINLQDIPEHSWVKVLGGRYTTDIGFAEYVGYNTITVWLILRISYTMQKTGKRKRSVEIPPYDLFDIEDYKIAYPDEPLEQSGSYTWKHNALHVEHGLIRKEFPHHRVLKWDGDISLDAHWLFLHSGHPIIHPLNLPRPKEWRFDADDLTKQLSTGRQGFVVNMAQSYAWF